MLVWVELCVAVAVVDGLAAPVDDRDTAWLVDCVRVNVFEGVKLGEAKAVGVNDGVGRLLDVTLGLNV